MRHLIRFCKGILQELLAAARPTMRRQISASTLILVMSVGAYAQPNEVQDILVTGVSSFGQANDIWQSFTPTQNGRLVKFTFDAGGNSPAGNRTVSIFEGEGTSGTLLQTFTYNFVGNTNVVSVTAEVDLPTPIQVTQGSQYTWAVTNINPRTLINTNPNTYTGGTGFATFNGTPFTNFDIGFSIVLDIGTNVSIASRDEVSTTDPFIFDVTFYGTPTSLESTDFNITNGTVSGLSMVTAETYELSVSTTGDGTVTVNFPAGSALVDGLDNDAATADVEVDLPPFQNPDLILTTTRIVQSGAQLFLNNAGINSSVFFAPAGTTNFTTGTSITQGTTVLVQDDPTCVPMPEVMCGMDPMTGLPDPPGCVPTPEVICTSSNQPVILAPANPGQYKLFLTDGAGSVVAVSSTTLFVTNETSATAAAITLDDGNILTGETANVTFAFLGAVTDFANDDLTVPNGTLSAVSSSDGNITFTATYTPNSDVVAANNVITLDNTGITDGATAGTGTTDSESFAIDTGIPKVSSVLCTTGCDDVYTAAGSNRILAIDINFDRDVTLTGSMTLELDFVVANRDALVTQNSARSFTATYNLTQSDLNTQLDYASTGALTLATASTLTGDSNGEDADLTLAAPGAVGSISENRTIYVDLIPPQIVTILRQDPVTETISGEEVTFRVTFTEAIDATSFGSTDFVLSGTAAGAGTVGTAQMVTSTVYDYTVTGLGNSSGTLGLSYNGALVDLVTNNALSAAAPGTDQQYNLINVIPAFETTSPVNSISQGDTYTYNIEVSSNIDGAGYSISASGLPEGLTFIQNDTIRTIAGDGTSGTTGNGGAAINARFTDLRDLAYDPDGNLYIIDRSEHMIRKIDTNGNISAFAGTGSAGFSGDGAAATAATLNAPSRIDFDADGNAYIADDANYRVRKVDTNGIISTIAGTGMMGFTGNGGAATSANLEDITGLAVGNGFLYIASTTRIREIDLSTGIIETKTAFNAPSGGFQIADIAVDALGSIYIASQGHYIRKIDGATSQTSTIAGNGSAGFSGDDGMATSAQLNAPNAIEVDDEGNVFVAEEENDRIRIIDQGGTIRTIAGNGTSNFSGDGGAAISANISNPRGLVVSSDGLVAFSDAGNNRIRTIQTNRARISGTTSQSSVGVSDITITATNGDESIDQAFVLTVNNVNDAPTLSPQLNASTIATEDEAYEYVTYANDIDGDLVELSVTNSPAWLTTAATTEVFTFTSDAGITDLVFNDDFFYLTNQDDHAIYRIDNLGGTMTQIAGQSNNSAGFSDGDGAAAAFETPFALDADSNGDLYVIDQDNHALRKITNVGGTVTVNTIAGNGSAGNATGAPSNATATFDTPTNVLVAPNDDIYIADAGNGVIKKLSGGMITTLQDGSGSDFTFTQPYGLAIDDSGVLYVTDFGDHTVYSINGTTRTLLAGASSTVGSADGAGSVALFDEPAGIVTNGDGSVLFVAESGNGLIRRLDIDGSTVTVSTLGSSLDTPVGMIQNPQNGALLVADIGFNSITEHYPAIKVSGTPTNDDTGKNTVEFTLNDGTADFAIEVALFIKNTNDAPAFTSTAPTATTQNDPFSYTLEGTDSDGNAIAYEATTLPSWLTFETNERIVSTVAGNGTDAFSGDGGAATDASIGTPDALAVDGEGNIYIAHENYIRRVDTNGNISTIVGDGTAANTGDSGPGVDAQITAISDMHVGPEGNLFISVLGGIRKLDINGTITSIAGAAGNSGTAGTGDGGPATAATFNQNSGIFVDGEGNVFVADQSDNTVRKINASDNQISTVATGVTFPFDIVVDKDGNIYAVNDGSTGLLKIDENDIKTDLTNSSSINFSTQDIAIDNLGNIYGTTSFSPANQVKVYNLASGEVSIIANQFNTPTFSGDGGVASLAQFNTISAVAVGPDGSVFVADQSNKRIRKLTPQNPKISGTPLQDHIGANNIVLNVSDGILSANQTFAMTVNNLPEITGVTATDGFYNEGDVIDIVVTFDGNINSSGTGTAPSIELETGDTDQTVTQSANSGSTITFSYTVQSGDTSSDLAYNSTFIAVGGYTIQSPEGVNAALGLPAAGSSGSLSANQAIVVDTETPTLTSVSIASDNATTSLAREGDKITLSITASEALGANPTVTIAGNAATVTNLTATTYEAIYTMTATDTEGTVGFTINFSDQAGNNGTEVTATTDGSAVTYDTTSPSVVLSSTVSEATNAENFDLTITFSTAVTGFTVEDLTLTNATASEFNGSDDVYTVKITPAAEGDLSIGVAENVAQDASGNSNVAATSFQTTYDVTPPTVALTAASTSVNAAFEATITFSEVVSNFELADLTVTNGTASNLTNSGTIYTATITPESEGEVTLNVAASIANDAAGNANTAGTALSVNYDVTGPTPTLSSASSATNAAFEVTITFNETVTGFTIDDLTVGNGAASAFEGSGTTYTATITPEAEGSVSISVVAEIAVDAANNSNVISNTLTVTYDTTAPTVTLSSGSAGTVTGAFEMVATFSESVTGFTSEEISVTNGSVSAFTGSGSSYSFTVTPTEEGEVSVSIAAGVAADEVGNSNVVSSAFTIDFVVNDTEAPSVALTSEVTSTSGAFDIGISFSESVVNFDVSDITVVNGSIGNLTGSSGEYTATITPLEEGTVEVSIAAGVTEDAAGNANTASNILSVTFDGTADTTAPSVTLSTASNNVSGSFDVNIAFSEAVTGFEIDDISVNNGNAAGLTGSGSTYAVSITPIASGTVTVSIAASVAEDAAGNMNTASNSLSVEFDGSADTSAPTVTISSSSAEVTEDFEIMITFNEEVTGFESSEVVVENGTFSGFNGSGSSYSGIVSPSATGTVTISIAAGIAQDAAGNGNEAGSLSVEATLSETTLSVGFSTNQVKVYPNPTADFVYLDLTIPVDRIYVFDLNGKVVIELENAQEPIDVSGLKGGTYLLKIQTKEGSLTKMFLKK